VFVEKLARKCILARKEYVPGKPIEEVQREYGITDIIKLASNENPLGASPLAIEAMVREIRERSNLYPESLCHDLTIKLANSLHLRPEQFFLDNGEDGVITMIGLTFINPDDEVVMGDLTFPAYENITTKMGGKCVYVPLTTNYALDMDGFIAAVGPKTKLIFVCNPNNPTGTHVNRVAFERLINSVPDDVLIVSDEAYFEYVNEADFPQTIPLLEKHPNLIILRTFSKIMGLAGLRLGYAIAHPDLVKVMLKAREPFPVNRIAQAGALAAMDDAAFIQETMRVNFEGRKQLYQAFDRMEIDYSPSQTNFVFIDLKKSVKSIYESMLRDGVIVRPTTYAGKDNFLRITIGTRDQNERMIQVLQKAMKN
jgi:histidinol-phosphate aminotransferase